jgi:beta-glucosidase
MFKVDFFASPDFTGPIIETQYRNNSSIDLTDSGPISLREAGKPYSVRSTSYLTPAKSGQHHLSLTSVGHSRLLVDGKLIVDNYDWTERGEAFYAFSSVENSVAVHLNKDQVYEIVVEAATKTVDAHSKISADDPAHVWSMQPSVRIGYLEELPSDMIGEAVNLANTCDYTVLVIGLSEEWESEGYDRKTLNLPGNQNELVSTLLERSLNPERIIIVNQSGSPVEMPWADDASTILQAWYGGQEAGNALADVLLGRVNPSGRLPISWPRKYSDLSFGSSPESWPGIDGRVVYQEGTSVGYRWYLENKVEPQWWFGHGLGYATFVMSNLKVLEDGRSECWTVNIKVKNTGQVSGRHVVQVYSRRSDHQTGRELRAFDKTAQLAPGESEIVRLLVKARDMAHWQDGKWLLEEGEYVLAISDSAGASATLHATISVSQPMAWNP